MHATCRSCGFAFLREDGYFLGSLVLSYFATSTVMVALLVSLLLIARWEIFPTLLLCSAVIILTNPLFFRLSRAVWLMLDHQASRLGFEGPSAAQCSPYGNSSRVTVIDCDYVEPEFAGAFLVRDGEEAAFIETNTTPAVPRLLLALEKAGLPREAVRYLIVTHVHLDHAGGASRLLAACPNATVLAHPRAARHLIDPSKLVASARHVYGAETFDRLYGQIDPIPSPRVRELADQEEVPFGSSRLRFIHTRGHAKHHFCILDPSGKGVFTGDSFGLRYPRLQRAGLFLFPSTSPTDFEPEEARKSAVRIARSGAETAYLTHFGAVGDLLQCEAQLLEGIDLHERVLLDLVARGEVTWGRPAEAVTEEAFLELREAFRKKLLGRGWNLSEAELQFLDLDLRLNAAGLVHVARTRLSAT